MRQILVTGATGVLVRAVVPRLVAAGHAVRALSRSEQNDELIRAMGAEPVRTDLFDSAALRQAMAGRDAVLHLATKIPPTEQARKPSAWGENDRIRSEATRLLVDATLAAGATTFVYPSVTFVYPDRGDDWIDAATTPPTRHYRPDAEHVTPRHPHVTPFRVTRDGPPDAEKRGTSPRHPPPGDFSPLRGVPGGDDEKSRKRG